MHYKNGREAKEGDRVVTCNLTIGTLHIVNERAENYNGRVSVSDSYAPYVTISECLHIDDTEFKE